MPRGTNGRQAERSEVATAKVLEVALELFSTRGYGATSMRQIAEACDQSTGNLYHHFGSKEAIFQRLIDDYWKRLLDPEHDLQKVFTKADFPDDLEELAAAIEQTVEENKASILLVFVDVIEHQGRHIRWFYETMADRFREKYGPHFEQLEKEGRLADADPMVAVMVATRWLFYFYMVRPHALRHGGATGSRRFYPHIAQWGAPPRGERRRICNPDLGRGGQHERSMDA
jgi:AcrR family transcriptional regulator